jgi:hypothetical protein
VRHFRALSRSQRCGRSRNQALIEKLPPTGPWFTDDRINWLKMPVMRFQVAYGADDEIEIKKKETAN